MRQITFDASGAMNIRERVAMRLASYDNVVLWGAGGLGRAALQRWLPRERVRSVVDSFAGGKNRMIEGFVVLAPDAIAWDEVDCVVIAASAQTEVRRQLAARKFQGPTLFIYELFVPPHDELTELEKLRIDIAAARSLPWLLFLFEKPQVLVNISFRLANYLSSPPLLRPLYWLSYALHHLLCVVIGIQLPLGTPIGPGLVFAHFGTIVFTRRAKIGSFFTIYHGCTVGTGDSGEGPVVGDFVTQYAGSHILGRCRLGDRCRIGANAVVVDAEAGPDSTLVGIPARIIGGVS